MRPTVCILMPMRNAEFFVREALMSILGDSTVELEVVSSSMTVVRTGPYTRSNRSATIGSRRSRGLDWGSLLPSMRGSPKLDGRSRCDVTRMTASIRVAEQVAWLDALCTFAVRTSVLRGLGGRRH